MEKPLTLRARFAVLVIATNLLAACATVFIVLSFHQSHQDYHIARATEECCKCFDPYFGTEFYCPAFEGSIDIFTHGLVKITNSDPSRLCTVTEITPEGFLKPVFRSYNALKWEKSAGDYASLNPPDCFDGGFCNISLPLLRNGSRYQLTSFNAPSYTAKDEVARFLEQTTFGPTLADIATFDTANLQLSFANWIKTQQTTVPLTSHREYFRRRLNTRYEFPSSIGPVTHPCQKGTRYRRFAISPKDYEKILTLEKSGDFTKLILDGFVRTVVSGQVVSVVGRVPFPDGRYRICQRMSQNRIGSPVYLEDSKLRCVAAAFNGMNGNPTIEFTEGELPKTLIMMASEEAIPIDTKYTNRAVPVIQEILVTSDLSDSICSSIAEPGNPIDAVFALYKGDYWFHDPRFELLDNTVESPLPDGGGLVVEANTILGNVGLGALCSNVPSTFLNEAKCTLSTSQHTCAAGSTSYQTEAVGPQLLIPLNETTIRVLYNESGSGNVGTLYLYAIDKLRIEDDKFASPPCQRNAKSRWVKEDCLNSTSNDTVAVSTGDATTRSIVESATEIFFGSLISAALTTDKNPNVLDVTNKIFTCPPEDQATVGFTVTDPTGQCWRNVHPDHLNVYDFTPWTRSHPGNSQFRNPIKEFAEAGISKLSFPSWHEMDRWLDNKARFRQLGRLGDMFNYYLIPATYRTPAFNAAVGVVAQLATTVRVSSENITTDSSGTLICGSPNEVANDPTLGGSEDRGAFNVWTRYLLTSYISSLGAQKMNVWTQIALEANDQLRQRVAWALAQILVISPTDITRGDSFTELFLVYYDIFVRNAFGNYRDVLKEVAYSPAMADMLTYYQSRSTAFEFSRDGSTKFADENFAREVMQLFTTGLYKLRSDGTKILDSKGDSIPVYTNDVILEYARVWTGFTGQRERGNNEGDNNRVDPMQVIEDWRDRFPKMGLDRKYVGDGLPLCTDLPSKHFLATGATYKLRGRTPAPLAQRDPVAWTQDPKFQRFKLEPNGPNSLFGILCGAAPDGSCQYAPKVVLSENISCTGKECFVDTIRTVEVADGIFYEYIRPPCVYQAFYDNAKLVPRSNSNSGTVCADPRTEVATTACLQGRSWNVAFWGERSTFATASKKCNAKLCTLQTPPSCTNPNFGSICRGNDRYWTNTDCTLYVKIDAMGNAAVVHQPLGVIATRIDALVRPDTKTFFRVDWSDASVVSNIIANCAAVSGCSPTVDEMCMCKVSVSETQVFFDGDNPSRDQVLNSLRVGAFDPSSLSTAYTSTSMGEVTLYSSTGGLTSESVFAVIDDAGVKQLRKNVKLTVSIVGANLSFRNPVHIISFADPEPRDAHYETDAALDHYFYHANTAPFVATRLAQRFGVSNPSPGYMERIVAAFRGGSYSFSVGSSTVTYGNGKYGDLGATIACILLDREARSVVLDADPVHGSAKEPLMKLIGLMRSLQFKLFDNTPFPEFSSETGSAIGQMAHQIPSVFSFFLPGNKPPGVIAQASVVSPEFQVSTGPRIVNLLNGLFSLIKYGLGPCYGGLGSGPGGSQCRTVEAGKYDTSVGRLTYIPSSGSAENVTNELATLMTAGRLSAASRQTIQQVFQAETNQALAVIKAQSIIVTSPEFHTTNMVRRTGVERLSPKSPQSSNKGYKAVVYVLLSGGADSYNMLVPHTCSSTNKNGQTLREQYNTERTTVAFTDDERTRIIDAIGQPCEQFAVHQNLEIVERLYNGGDLAFFANAGVLNIPVTKANYIRATKTTLFDHNSMQKEAQRVDPFDKAPASGILGRMCDVLATKGFNPIPITVEDVTIATAGKPGIAIAPLSVSSTGTGTFNPKPRKETFDPIQIMKGLNGASQLQSSVYGETWSNGFVQALYDADIVRDDLSKVKLTQAWDTGAYSRRLKTVASLISARIYRGTDRDVLFVDLGGWDHHAAVKENLSLNFAELNKALTYFHDEMEAQGLWDSVSLFVTSDFGRTLTANSGDGTDHGWGGHYFMMGGSVQGGKIHGQYPQDITEDGPVNIGRGRIMPTTSWDSILNSVVEWMGVEDEDGLNYCLPNRRRTGSNLLTKGDVFVG